MSQPLYKAIAEKIEWICFDRENSSGFLHHDLSNLTWLAKEVDKRIKEFTSSEFFDFEVLDITNYEPQYFSIRVRSNKGLFGVSCRPSFTMGVDCKIHGNLTEEEKSSLRITFICILRREYAYK